MDDQSLTPAWRRRVVIQDVQPSVEAGRFSIKRCVGDDVLVQATLFADGSDRVRAVLAFRPLPETVWREVPMDVANTGLDVWKARFTVDILAFYEFRLHAWIDIFATWRDALAKKSEARQGIDQDLKEGALLIRAAGRRASGADRDFLNACADRLERSGDEDARAAAALDERLAEKMRAYDGRAEATDSAVFRVQVERVRARFGSWYEMFPRSAGPSADRSATLREAESRLDGIAQMGFDVVYLPPIHPIGVRFRKGPNNNPRCSPQDPGSPWAIGSSAGGHKAVDPGLGTLDDFSHFVAAARGRGLEVALDLAYQCSPDHPYVRDHPEWFHRRPDGSIHYAENSPKKYEDIYPFDFECENWKALWEELKSVVLFWAERGVRIFRVDNPHTKPLRFWEWLIAETQRQFPDLIFLAEAFTRPAVMQRLAKGGFSQSYTYFTWRTTAAELREHLTELTQTPVREFLRPNLFVNTPDILHAYLQTGGRPAFEIRFLLAATLGASYGIYGPPFELCEAKAFPETEDYVDSEKYQIRSWDWDRPGNLKSLIGRVNRLRKEHRALQFDQALAFYPVDNPHLLFYGKKTEDGASQILVIVNLDPHHVQAGWVQVPRAAFGLGDSYTVKDLLTDESFSWHGDSNFVQLDPQKRPAHIFEVTHAAV